MKVLVVDDEKFIRKGIVTILQKSELKLLMIEEARNGEEALEMNGLKKYDLIISDIRMPKMTGLDFLKAISKDEEKPNVIFISGYNDFNYAKEAIKFGASGYLLKPINKEELLETVHTLIQNRYQRSLKNLFRNQLQTIFIHENKPHSGYIAGLKDIHSVYYIGIMKILVETTDQPNILEEGVQELRSFARTNNLGSNIFIDLSKNIVVITHDLDEIDQLFQYLMQINNRPCILSFSKEAVILEGLRSHYDQVSELSHFHKLLDLEIINEDHIQGRKNNYCNPEELVRKLNGYIHGAKTDSALKLCEVMYSTYAQENYPISYFDILGDSITREIVEPILSALPQSYMDLHRLFAPLLTFEEFNKIIDYIKLLRQFIIEMSENLALIKSQKVKIEKVQKAIEYIENHYNNKKLNMAIVSNYVSLNYSYFSQLFKEETGKNFVEYLSAYRIQKALVLLAQTSLKIYEVAEKVGYNEARHFLKVFKEFQELTPNEYRKKVNYEMISEKEIGSLINNEG